MHGSTLRASIPRGACQGGVTRALGPRGCLRAKASDVLAEKLRELICRAPWARDALPTERELVAQSGLSRTSVREALRVLETEGLVATKAGRNGGCRCGARAAKIHSRSFALFVRSHGVRSRRLLRRRARRSSPPRAACGDHRTDEDLAEIRAFIAASGVSDDVDEHVRLNLQWHRP